MKDIDELFKKKAAQTGGVLMNHVPLDMSDKSATKALLSDMELDKFFSSQPAEKACTVRLSV